MGDLIPPNEHSGEMAVTGAERDAMAVATTRAAEEVKAAMVIAQKFPRDENKALAKIVRACQRPKLAEQSQYEYHRGGQPVTGPTIRLAEAMAQAWGNLNFGIVELAQDDESSVVQSFCHDLESNTRQIKQFSVPHTRYTKKGSYKLNDPRDVYEQIANQGARRLRACILGIIPGDVVDRAVQECEKTLAGGSDKPLADRIREMVVRFDAIGVSADDIVTKLGHKIEACTPHEIVSLGKRYKAIQDGFSTAVAEFPPADNSAKQQADLKVKMAQGQQVNPEPAAKPKTAKKATKAAKKTAAPPEEPPLEKGESFNQQTGEISEDFLPADEPQGPDDYDPPAEAPAADAGLSEREKLIGQYHDLCQAADVKPRSVSSMSNEALSGHIAALIGK